MEGILLSSVAGVNKKRDHFSIASERGVLDEKSALFTLFWVFEKREISDTMLLYSSWRFTTEIFACTKMLDRSALSFFQVW